MQVFLLALGSRGDIELFLTLGNELSRRGHGVTMGVCSFQRAMVEEAGLRSVEVATGAQAELVEVFRSLERISDKVERTRQYVRSWLLPKLKQARALVAAHAGDCDYFISNLQLQMEKNGRPLPSASIIYDPPIVAPGATKPTQSAGHVLILAAMNKGLVDPKSEWDPSILFTGFWHRKQVASPKEEIKQFLSAGDPPVVLTMGSLATFNSKELLHKFSDALTMTGKRGIVLCGWTWQAAAQRSTDTMLVAENVPYEWLFPQACVVIHHGAYGAVAESARAGVPSILLPQIAAQEKFAEMLAREKLSAATFESSDVSADTLAKAIVMATTDSQIRNACLDWKSRIGGEQGVELAVNLVEQHWQQFATNT